MTGRFIWARGAAAALSIVLASLAAFAAPAAAEAPEQIEWDLTDLYADDAAWRAAYDAAKSDVAALTDHQGSLAKDAASMAEALEAMSAVAKEVARIYVYASLKSDADQRVSEAQQRTGEARSLYVSLGEATAWVQPELIEAGAEKIQAFRGETPRLDPFGHYLEDVLRNAPHTLGDEAEQVLAAAGNVLSSPSEIYELLVNADVTWPTLTLSTGEEALLNQAGYSKHRSAENREDRKAVFDTFWGAWGEYLDSIGMVLNTEVNANVFLAKSRKYDSTLEMQLSEENIPPAVYKTLVKEVNDSLPTLHRYFKLRGRLLGVEDLRYYDIYPPLVSLDKKFDLKTSRDLTMAALQPFGALYLENLEKAVDGQWAHVYPQQGKRSGAYMNGSAYDVHPYVLLNHNDDFNSLSTYAHEWGHAVHSMLANEAQPFETADYSTFTAEIASIISEILLEEYMIANAETRDEKLYYLGYALEAMRGSFYRQTMFSEFESAIHEAVENGEALTGARMSSIYGDLLRRYHGHDEGVMTIDDAYAAEWAYIPHFYYDFYVYQYATS
ncbi:MAG: M3 family oligoendopeptidase, partial [Pseudomonadota bacterium]